MAAERDSRFITFVSVVVLIHPETTDAGLIERLGCTIIGSSLAVYARPTRPPDHRTWNSSLNVAGCVL